MQIGLNSIPVNLPGFSLKIHIEAVKMHTETSVESIEAGLGVNAGHDLNLHNLTYYLQNVPGVMEVSIGHALICDAIYFGIHNTIQMYRHQIDLASQ